MLPFCQILVHLFPVLCNVKWPNVHATMNGLLSMFSSHMSKSIHFHVISPTSQNKKWNNSEKIFTEQSCNLNLGFHWHCGCHCLNSINSRHYIPVRLKVSDKEIVLEWSMLKTNAVLRRTRMCQSGCTFDTHPQFRTLQVTLIHHTYGTLMRGRISLSCMHVVLWPWRQQN